MSLQAPVVGVDIGGTKISVGLVAPGGQVTGLSTVPTPRSGDEVVERVVGLVRGAAAAYDGGGVAAVGIGAAGVVDPERGVVVGSTDAIAGWAGVQLAERVCVGTGLGVRVVNDVVAFLLAEREYGAARNCDHVLAVTVGTGIGGALLLDGRVLRGHHDVAGHVGHLVAVAAEGRRCSCGRLGHIEAVASGPAMAADFAARAGGRPSLQDVVAAEQAGDPLAHGILVRAGTALGETLGGLVNAVGPALVLLGGGVVSGASTFVTAVRDALPLALLPALADVRIALGALGTDAAVVGAAVAARDARP